MARGPSRPQGGSAHGRLALETWEAAYRDTRRRAWSEVFGRPSTALEEILLPILHSPGAGRLSPRITYTPLPLVPVGAPACAPWPRSSTSRSPIPRTGSSRRPTASSSASCPTGSTRRRRPAGSRRSTTGCPCITTRGRRSATASARPGSMSSVASSRRLRRSSSPRRCRGRGQSGSASSAFSAPPTPCPTSEIEEPLCPRPTCCGLRIETPGEDVYEPPEMSIPLAVLPAGLDPDAACRSLDALALRRPLLSGRRPGGLARRDLPRAARRPSPRPRAAAGPASSRR